MSRPPAILSSWFLPVTSAVLTLAMGALCVWQWQRESSLHDRWQASETRAARAEEDAQSERTRADGLTQRHLEASARVEELNRTLADIRAQLTPLQKAAAERDTMAATLQQARQRLTTANQSITALNQNARAQKAALDQLAHERNSLARLLNERTQAYNDLVKKVETGKKE